MDRPPNSSSEAASEMASTSGEMPSETTRLIEKSRLRAKALQEQNWSMRHDAANNGASRTRPPAGSLGPNSASDSSPGEHLRKRPHSSIDIVDLPSSNRNAGKQDDVQIRPARNFAKYVDYNFSAMTDTKGGFLSTEDDPWNKALAPAPDSAEAKPAHMTVAEWERMQAIRNLKRLKQGPYEPGLSVLVDRSDQKKCRECGSLEIDWVWEDVFKCCVCGVCKEKFPEKYSLLTKTECREDYLLTDPELKDAELLPHLSRPNPHKSHWHDMMLFLRYQVEDYAINTKWGSAEALDAEFERRETEKKRRKESKFREKLLELKKKTRTEAYRRNNAAQSDDSSRATTFGDAIGNAGRHSHDWGRAVENEEGMSVRRCVSCGMEVEELEF